MGGISLGGAFFEVDANAAGLIQAMAKAEAASKKSVEAISKATGVAEKDVQRLANTYVREEAKRAKASTDATLKIIKAYNDAGDAADKAARKASQATKSAEGGFGSGTKSAIGFGVALLGIGGAAEIARRGIGAVFTATKELEQAQFAVNKLYGGGSKDITEFAEQLAKSSGKSKADALEAAAAAANLGRQYAFTSDQIKNLLKVSADLAAVKGITLEQATSRVSDAMRGEAEAAEYLGQTLGNDAVKAFAKMTDEQRKNFESLDPITKAQIVYGKLVSDNNDLVGAAAERTKTLGGATDNLKGSMSDLGATLGSSVAPALIDISTAADGATKSFTAMLKEGFKLQELGQPNNIKRLEAIVLALSGKPATLVQQISQGRAVQEEQAASGGPTVAFGPTPTEVKDAIARYEQLQAGQRDAVRQFVDERKKAIKEVAEADEKAARAEADRVEKSIEREKIRLEVEREGRLKALAERERDTLRVMEVIAAAEKMAYEAAIEQAEQRKDAEIAAADEAHDRVVAAIEAQQDALEETRELEDRAREDERRAEDQTLDDFRRNQDAEVKATADAIEQKRDLEDRARDDRRRADDQDRSRRREEADRELQEDREREDRRLAQRAQSLARARQQEDRARAAARQDEDRALADARAAEDAALEASQDQRLAQITNAHDARIKIIDDEIDALTTAFEAEEEARQEVHDAALAGLEAEADAVRRAHEDAMDALDEQARAEDDRHRNAIRAIDAEKDARLAAIDAELGLLNAADDAEARAVRDQGRRDNIVNKEFGLKRAQSTGNQSEIEKAEQELAAAIDELRQDGVKDDRDAQRAILLARKKAVEDDIDAQKKAEDERNRIRDREIDDARDVARTTLEAQLDAIEAREAALKAAYEADRKAARDALDARLKELQERKDAEQAAHDVLLARLRAEFDAEKKRIDDRRLAEDRDRADRRLLEDNERTDRRTKEDDQLTKARQRLSDRRKDEDDDRADRRRKEDDERAASRLAQDRKREDERNAEDVEAGKNNERRQLQRLDEDRVIAESRREQDRRRSDERDAEDKALAVQLAAAAATQELERKAIEAHYNGPGGIIPTIQAAMKAADEAYKERLRLAKIDFEAEREAIKDVYQNTAKTGLIDLQNQAAENNRIKLADQLGAISSWKEQANQDIDENKGKWKDLGEAIEDVGKKIKGLPKTTIVAPNSQGGFGSVPYGPGGPGPTPPPPVTPTPAPGMGTPTPGSGGVNVDPDRFTTSFPFMGRYTNPFNPRIPRHRGVDLVIAGARRGGFGMPVGAFRDGTVTATTIDPNGGNGVTIRHNDGLYGRYFHFDTINARQGTNVRRGDQIGTLGESGTEGSPHLHYEIARNGSVGDYEDGGLPLIDPGPYMRDTGYLFRHPTMTYTPATGERNLIAERRPEQLMGGGPTASMLSGGGPNRSSLLGAPPAAMRYGGGAGPHALMGGGGSQTHVVQLKYGHQVLKEMVFQGISLNVRDGDIVEVRR